MIIFFERHKLSSDTSPNDILDLSHHTVGNGINPTIWLSNSNHQVTYSLNWGYTDDAAYVQIVWGATVRWYSIAVGRENRPGYQLNQSSVTYDYIAFG